ncbi:MAG: hypothetical protein ACR2KK_16425, partial [Acidimicrobiales bacterium]
PREGTGRERPADGRPEGGRPAREGSGRERAARAQAGAQARSRPAAKRIQAGRAHRDAVLGALPPEQRAIAEQVMRGGLSGVRQAVEEQNSQARAAGGPEIRPEAILTLAEELLPSLRAAEWRDRAEAAAVIVDEIGLRDLRAVVAGADTAGRDEESRALATRLRDGLERRSAAERQTWMDEIATCLTEGRVVRALRVSSRAPEQGLRLPAELSAGLSTAVAEAMSPETAPDRWLALLEAVLASPVRRSIVPKGLPTGADQETLKTIRQAMPKVPALGPLLGESPSSRPVPPPPPRRPPPPAAAAAPPAPAPAPATAPAETAPPAPAASAVADEPPPGPQPDAPEAEAPAPEPVAPEAVAPEPAAPEPAALDPIAAAPEPVELEAVAPDSPASRPEVASEAPAVRAPQAAATE